MIFWGSGPDHAYKPGGEESQSPGLPLGREEGDAQGRQGAEERGSGRGARAGDHGWPGKGGGAGAGPLCSGEGQGPR